MDYRESQPPAWWIDEQRRRKDSSFVRLMLSLSALVAAFMFGLTQIDRITALAERLQERPAPTQAAQPTGQPTSAPLPTSTPWVRPTPPYQPPRNDQAPPQPAAQPTPFPTITPLPTEPLAGISLQTNVQAGESGVQFGVQFGASTGQAPAPATPLPAPSEPGFVPSFQEPNHEQTCMFVGCLPGAAPTDDPASARLPEPGQAGFAESFK
jgi:hypothetical protein